MTHLLDRLVGRDPAGLEDLLGEVQEKNTLTVTVFRAIRGDVGVRHRRVEHEQHAVTAQTPALVRADLQRMRAGKKPIYLAEALRRRGLDLVAVAPNLRTNIGADFVAANMSGTSVAVADVIALSANGGGASATHGASVAPWNTAQTTDGTTGEFTTYGGLARASAVYAHTVTGPATATNTYTLSKTFTANNVVTNVRLAGLFGGSGKASQGGSDATNMLVLESAFTAATLASSDQLALTWTISV